jgi:adenylate cyclase
MTNQETERKFLVKGDFKSFASHHTPIKQGFLSSVPERTVRIRITSEKGWLTIKGIGNKNGTTRFEWEKEISIDEAQSLLKLCEPGIIEKTRYFVPIDSFVFEVDVFHGENQGLILAEIELPNENTPFSQPDWLGKEVTGNVKYYNAYLSKNSYKKKTNF